MKSEELDLKKFDLLTILTVVSGKIIKEMFGETELRKFNLLNDI